MASRQQNNRNSINKEKILLACIPVIGGIIMAVFNYWIKPDPDPVPVINVKNLKIKGGEVNDMIVFRRYNDLSEMMVAGLRPIITQEKFNSVADSIEIEIGRFIKPIDTSYSNISGSDIVFVKNQYERGVTVNQIIFDGQGKIFGLYSSKF